MIGLLIIGFFVVYLAVSIVVVVVAANIAKKHGRSPWRWGGLTTFVMYNLVFWDFIPTLAAHKYYCETQAGFWIYKTPEQWKAENMELTAEELKPLGKSLHAMPYRPLHVGSTKIVLKINNRIYLDSKYEENLSILPIHKLTSFVADIHDEQRLAKLVTYQSGYGNPMTGGDLRGFKSWLNKNNCSNSTSGDYERESGYTAFLARVVKLGEQQ